MIQRVARSYRPRRPKAKRRGLTLWGRIKLAIAIVVVGAAAYSMGSWLTMPGIWWKSKDQRTFVQIDGGGFYLGFGVGDSTSLHWALNGLGKEEGANIAGICIRERIRDWNQNVATERWWFLGLPWWLFVAPIFIKRLDRYLGTLGRRDLARRWQAARTRRTQCPACGYDVRASPTRCPECGKPLPPYWLRTNMSRYR